MPWASRRCWTWASKSGPKLEESTSRTCACWFGISEICRRPRTTTLNRRAADILYAVKVYGYPEKGLAFTQVNSQQIENKIVFPPSAELPFGLR